MVSPTGAPWEQRLHLHVPSMVPRALQSACTHCWLRVPRRRICIQSTPVMVQLMAWLQILMPPLPCWPWLSCSTVLRVAAQSCFLWWALRILGERTQSLSSRRVLEGEARRLGMVNSTLEGWTGYPCCPYKARAATPAFFLAPAICSSKSSQHSWQKGPLQLKDQQ